MPDLPHPFRAAAYAPETSEDLITLLTLTGTSQGTLRVCNQATTVLTVDPFADGTQHGGDDYQAKIVSVAPPGADPDALPHMTIVLGNPDGEYDWLDEEGDLEDVGVVVREVLKSDPETIVRQFTRLVIDEVAPEDALVAIALGNKGVRGERFPAQGMSKSRAPGLFRS